MLPENFWKDVSILIIEALLEELLPEDLRHVLDVSGVVGDQQVNLYNTNILYLE